MTAFFEEILWVSLLEIAGADLTAGNLGRNRDHRRHAAMRVKKTVDQVKVPWPATPGAGGQFPSQLRFGASGKRGCFLVTDMDPLQLAISAHRVRHWIQAVTYKAVDPLDTSFH
jgi:hypothetical protein